MNDVVTELRVVGTRPVRPDGVDKVTGRAQFGADMVMPGMLWGKVKRSPHAASTTSQSTSLPAVRLSRSGIENKIGRCVTIATASRSVASEVRRTSTPPTRTLPSVGS